MPNNANDFQQEVIGVENATAHSGGAHPEIVLKRVVLNDVAFHTDPGLFERSGIRIAFTERTGGVSAGPYGSLNLASHVGDAAEAVDVNRDRLFDALGCSALRSRLITAEQVHGVDVRVMRDSDAGHGAYAEHGAAPIPATDGLVTTAHNLPLLMLYADCVPVILVAEEPVPAVAVVHAGWRGAYGLIVERGVERLTQSAGTDPTRVAAYIGAHIGSCCYSVDATTMSQFANRFDTITAVDARLDLRAVVAESLKRAGVRDEAVIGVDACTFDQSDRFFSYRARQRTGRHGALVMITEVE